MSILIPLIAIIALVIIHELGHFLAAKLVGVKVLEFSVGFPPRILSFTHRSTKFSFGALLLGGFVKLKGDGADSEDTSPDSLSGTSTLKKVIILFAGVIMNLVAAWFLFILLFTHGVSLPSESLPKDLASRQSHDAPTLSFFDAAPDSPADIANLPLKKKISAITNSDGVVVNPNQDQFTTEIKKGLPAEISFEGREDSVVVTPAMVEGQYRIGVSLLEDIEIKKSFPQAIGDALSYTAYISKQTFLGFIRAVHNVVTPQSSHIGADSSVSGPIGIVKILSSTLAEGYSLFLVLVAIISINLAVLNVLPLPILDGGRILVVLFEAARGKRISVNAQAVLNGIGILFILALAVFGVINDLK